MQALREITGGSFLPHTYLLDGTTLIAYIKVGETKPFFFKNGIKGFSKSYRKFEEVKLDWDILLKAHVKAEPQPNFIKKVQGSKPGVTYEVNTNENTCTCPGYTFRGSCKHVKELEAV
jgi:hypothetical protein